VDWFNFLISSKKNEKDINEEKQKKGQNGRNQIKTKTKKNKLTGA
jgi:hypothetical protein